MAISSGHLLSVVNFMEILSYVNDYTEFEDMATFSYCIGENYSLDLFTNAKIAI